MSQSVSDLPSSQTTLALEPGTGDLAEAVEVPERAQLLDTAIADLADAMRVDDVDVVGDALSRVFEYSKPTIGAVCYQWGLDGVATEDTIATVVEKVWMNAERYIPGSSADAWIATITHNSLIDQTRKAAARHEQSQDPEIMNAINSGVADVSDFELIEASELLRGLQQAMSSEYFQVLYLREYLGFSTKETADILDVPTGTVQSRLLRAKKQARQVLSDNATIVDQ